MSDDQKKVDTLPFEPSAHKLKTLGGLAKQDVLQELENLPADSVSKHLPIMYRNFYNPPTDVALDAKLDKLKDLPANELKTALAQLIPSSPYEYGKFMDRLPLTQIDKVKDLIYKVKNAEVAVDNKYRHTVGGKFVNELFDTPDFEKAHAEFPKVPVERRREWFDKAVNLIVSSVVEPESFRLKACLAANHTPGSSLAHFTPCGAAAQSLESARQHFDTTMDGFGNCADLVPAFRKVMIDRPDYELAKTSYMQLNQCIKAVDVYARIRAGLLRDQHKAGFNDILAFPSFEKKDDGHH